MKVSLVRTMLSKMTLTVAAFVMPFTFTMGADANGPADIESLSAFRVKFISGDNEELLFNVKYNNKDHNSFKLLVLDETGEPLFEDNYSKNLDKKLSVPRLTDSEHVIFVVKSSKENIELSFKVKVTARVVDSPVFTEE